MKFSIQSSSRLHFTLIDLNGTIGRIDGGIGLALKDPYFKIEFEGPLSAHNEEIKYDGPSEYLPLIMELRRKIEVEYNVVLPKISVKIAEKIPQHRGLGSKTQFLLTIARGLLEFVRNDIADVLDLDELDGLAEGRTESISSILRLASLVGRGGTSGIGYMAFGAGKFIMDLGHSFGQGKDKESFLPSSASKAPPALPFYRINFPESWPILLIDLNVKQGANASEEVQIFRDKCPIDINEVRIISHEILFKLIPSIIERDLENFASALHTISLNGFKKLEISLQHPYVGYLIDYIYEKYNLPVGMSSFGPMIYVICSDINEAEKIMNEIRNKIESDENSPGGIVRKTFANNRGFRITFST